MVKSIYGLNIIRAYELSWLNDHGKPQLGIVEMAQNLSSAEIDTWDFKIFLENLNNKKYTSINAVKNSICDFLGVAPECVNIIPHENFNNVEFFEQIKHESTTNCLSRDFRFICQKSGQPYIGKINILLDAPKPNEKPIENIITSLRNKKFVPNALVEELFSQLQDVIKNNFVLSVHLNRRGGISYQALRSNYATDFSGLNRRSVLE